MYCGRCFHCLRGEQNLCDDREVLGVSPGPYRRHGAFAEFVAVPRRIMYRLPENLSFEQAAMIEAVSVAVHAVSLTPIRLGDSAVVVGSGMIGLLTIQAARNAGCIRVIAVDPDEGRLKLALAAGATDAINPKATGAVEAIQALTGGRGADVALECVGATEPIRDGDRRSAQGRGGDAGGECVAGDRVAAATVVSRQVRVQGSCASNGEYPACIEMMSRGAIRVDTLISAVAPLEEGASWFDRLYRHEPNLMKVILRP